MRSNVKRAKKDSKLNLSKETVASLVLKTSVQAGVFHFSRTNCFTCPI